MTETFLDTKVFDSLVRPQYHFSCNITSITSAYNYLFDEDITQEKVAEILERKIEGPHGPGNRTLISWIDKLMDYKEKNVTCNIFFEKGWDFPC